MVGDELVVGGEENVGVEQKKVLKAREPKKKLCVE